MFLRFYLWLIDLFRLNIISAKVYDLPMKSRYNNTGESSLSPIKVIFPFFSFHLRNTFKRIIYNYFLRNFSFASINLLLGIVLTNFGIFYGLYIKKHFTILGELSTPVGYVIMIYTIIIIATQFILSFINLDMSSEPKEYKNYDN